MSRLLQSLSTTQPGLALHHASPHGPGASHHLDKHVDIETKLYVTSIILNQGRPLPAPLPRSTSHNEKLIPGMDLQLRVEVLYGQFIEDCKEVAKRRSLQDVRPTCVVQGAPGSET